MARPRAGASICPELDRSTVEQWLRDAIRTGHVSDLEGPTFPKYVWTEQNGQCFEGRLINQTLGEYKGYPVDKGYLERILA